MLYLGCNANETTKENKMIKVTCKKSTSDPITYRAEATITANGITVTGSYNGDENEGRKEVKEGAMISLRVKARKLGMTI